MKFSTFLFVLIFLFSYAWSQDIQDKKSFQKGRMVFNIHYLDSVLLKNPIQESSFPKEIIYVVSGNQYRIEIQSEFTGSSILANLESKVSDTYIHFLNKNYKLHTNLDSLCQSAFSRTPYSLNFTKQYKEIQGFHCEKVQVHYSNPNLRDIILYYTDEISNFPNPYNYAFYKIPGMIMELEENFQGIPIRIELLSLQKIPIDPDLFEPLKGYQTLSLDDFIKKSMEP